MFRKPVFFLVLAMIMAAAAGVTWVNRAGAGLDAPQPEADIGGPFDWRLIAKVKAPESAGPVSFASYGYSDGLLVAAGGPAAGAEFADRAQLWALSGGDLAAELKPLASAKLSLARRNMAIAGDGSSFFLVAGQTSDGPSPYVELLSWDPAHGSVQAGPLPELPQASAEPGATIWSGRLVVATALDGIYSLGLDAIVRDDSSLAKIVDGKVLLRPEPRYWQQISSAGLPSQPSEDCGPLRLATQHDGIESRLFAFTICRLEKGAVLTSWALRQGGDEGEFVWVRRAEMTLTSKSAIMKAVVAQGQANILVAVEGGDTLVYNTIIDRWRVEPGALPAAGSANLVADRGAMIDIVSQRGEGQVWSVALRGESRRFGLLDMSVIAVYLVSIVAIGVWFHRRNTSADAYFRGGQSIPWWVAACSIHAALLSSLTYLALPALVYRTNWVLYVGMVMVLPITPVVSRIVMPFFRRIDATSAYEYLSLRFNMPIRLLASSIFVIFQTSRIGIILSLTGLAMAMITPLAPWQSVLIVGGLSMVYCSLGGVEAVVWTEVLQTLVLAVGALICFGFLVVGVDSHFAGYVHAGLAADKFKMFDLGMDRGSHLRLSLWVMVFGGMGQALSTYSADQSIIQRYMVTADERKAARSIWLNALVSVPSVVIFFLIGTGLFAFYQSHPERLDPSIQTDQIFPYFIANEIPVGLAGLIIAGVFAATQAAVASSMNSVASTLVVDFLRVARGGRKDQDELKAGRLFTVLVGVMGTAIGLLFISPEIRSLMEQYIVIIGLCMGALCGLFLTGMLTQRVGSLSAFIGLAAGVAVMASAWRYNLANGYLIGTIGIACNGVIAWLASLILQAPRQNLVNLTIFTMSSPALRVRPSDPKPQHPH